MQVDSNGSRSIAEYAANSACTTFTADVGLLNGSTPMTVLFAAIADDGAPVTLVTVAPGRTAHVTFDLTGVYDRKLVATVVSGSSRGSRQAAAWGDAFLTCTAAE